MSILQVGTREQVISEDQSRSEVIHNGRESGMLVGLRALQQFLLLGPQRMGDAIYLGTLPAYPKLDFRLRTDQLLEVVQVLWEDATVRFYVQPNSGEIALIEVFGDRGDDPVELYCDRYETVGEGPARKLPKRIRLQYGTQPVMVIDFDQVDFIQPERGNSLTKLPSGVRYIAWEDHSAAVEPGVSTLPAENSRQGFGDAAVGSLQDVVVMAELKTVKLYGGGGFANLDFYQSGLFISEAGHILTVWSTVLDVEQGARCHQ